MLNRIRRLMCVVALGGCLASHGGCVGRSARAFTEGIGDSVARSLVGIVEDVVFQPLVDAVVPDRVGA